jgi:hypothetical protein
MSKAARKLLESEDDIKYDIVGDNVCMGDHKVSSTAPPYLRLAHFSFSLFSPSARFLKIPNQIESRYSQ